MDSGPAPFGASRNAIKSSSQLRRGARQQFPVVALLLPVHQDVKIGRHFLPIGHHFLLAEPVEAYDRGGTDDPDREILIFERQEF
jgi:hypothetical protein